MEVDASILAIKTDMNDKNVLMSANIKSVEEN